MRRLVRKCFSTRRATAISSVVIALLVSSTAAIAAFILFQGLNGTSNGTFGAANISVALTASGAAPQITGPGDDKAFPFTVHNNDTVQHTLTGITPTFTSTPSNCASFLGWAYGTNPPQLPQAIPGGGDFTFVGGLGLAGSHIIAQPTLPQTCASGTYTITWSGTETKP